MIENNVNYIAGPEFLFTLIAVGIIVAVIIYVIKRSNRRIEFTCVHCNHSTKSERDLGYHLDYCDSFKQWKLQQNSKKNPLIKSNIKQDEQYLYILKQRLAKGEITKEEYQELKKEFE